MNNRHMKFGHRNCNRRRGPATHAIIEQVFIGLEVATVVEVLQSIPHGKSNHMNFGNDKLPPSLEVS